MWLGFCHLKSLTMKLSQRHLDSLDLKHTDNLSENGESITVARQKVEAVKCLICEKPYKSKKGLYDHNKRIHLGLKNLSTKLVERVPCTICGLNFNKGSISTHCKSIHLGQRRKRSVTKQCTIPTPEQKQRRKQQKQRKKNQCSLCEKVYSDKRDLDNHVNAVHLEIKKNENEHICEVCGKGFSFSKNLKKHLKITHTNEKKYACKICQQKFQENVKLIRHMKSLHLGLKPYGCDICGTKFSLSSNLKSHLRIVHEKIKPFECHICLGRFSVKFNLNTHMKIHQSVLSCTYCENKYLDKSELESHIKTSHEYCNICREAFENKFFLEIHVKQHLQ